MRINKVVFHCSDSDYTHHGDISVIRDWHVNGRGWSDVGYHYFIRRDGTIQIGRALSIVGAHVRGENSDSIGICLHGKTFFTQEQFDSAQKLYDNLKYLIPDLKAFGHRDFDNRKTCPNFEVKEKLKL